MIVEKESVIEIKKRLVSIADSLLNEDCPVPFEEGILVGKIYAYVSVLGFSVPVDCYGTYDLAQWIKETFN